MLDLESLNNESLNFASKEVRLESLIEIWKILALFSKIELIISPDDIPLIEVIETFFKRYFSQIGIQITKEEKDLLELIQVHVEIIAGDLITFRDIIDSQRLYNNLVQINTDLKRILVSV